MSSKVQQQIKGEILRWTLRFCLLVNAALLALFARLRRNSRRERASCDVLLTGTFYSRNWVMAHILPLARSQFCNTVLLVTTTDLDPVEGVVIVRPPQTLQKMFGEVGARLLWFCWIAARKRPGALGGFHLLFNGTISILLGKVLAIPSIYFCVGGPAEVLDGGLMSENRLFQRLPGPDARVERRLIDVVGYADYVVTMGTRAKEFFKERGITRPIHVISGHVDIPGTGDSSIDKEYDMIFVGRLSPIKRVDLFIDTVALLRERRANIRAVIVGDGALRESLVQQVEQQGLQANVEFAGFQGDVTRLLRRSCVFVMTSDSEGLSLALMEAMASGLPAVVANVGDLGDLVEDGVNGYLVDAQDPALYAEKVLVYLDDESKRASASRAARQSAEVHAIDRSAQKWDAVLGEICGRGGV